MTTNDLAAIRARAEKATRGPWESRVAALIDYRRIVTVAGDGQSAIAGMIELEDAAFIAAARTDVPLLCDEVEALRGELARAREVLYRSYANYDNYLESGAMHVYNDGDVPTIIDWAYERDLAEDGLPLHMRDRSDANTTREGQL